MAFYLNTLSFWLCVASVPFIICYPLAKRFFPIPQLVLSLCWGFAVLISWSAVTNSLVAPTWLLWGATVAWTLGFDTVYAMSDREDDLKVGINSSAIFFGKYAAEAVGFFFALTTVLMVWLGFGLGLGSAFWVAVVIAFGVWVWQYLRLRNPRLPRSAYGKIFGQNVWVGFILLAGMILGYLA